MRRMLVLAATLTLGCPKDPAPVPAAAQAPVPEGPRMVRGMADLVGAVGVRGTVTGVLERRTPDGVDPVDGGGTAVVLDDGTAIYVSEGAPPEGWDWLIGQRIRVQGTVWETAPDGWPHPALRDPEAPMPADVGVPMMTP